MLFNYLSAYLIDAYGMNLGAVSLPLTSVGISTVIGSHVGGPVLPGNGFAGSGSRGPAPWGASRYPPWPPAPPPPGWPPVFNAIPSRVLSQSGFGNFFRKVLKLLPFSGGLTQKCGPSAEGWDGKCMWRRKNFIPRNAFLYQTATGITYDSGAYEEGLNRVLELADYGYWRKLASERGPNEPSIGIGLATVLKSSGSSGDHRTESARVKIDPTGQVTVFT